MRRQIREDNIFLITKWIAIILVSIVIATLFMPFAYETLLDETTVYYPTLQAVMGGDFYFSEGVYDYSITFNLNIFLLIAYQFAILSGVAFFFLGRKKTNLVVALVLAFLSFVALILTPHLVKLGTPGFVINKLHIGIGPIIASISLFGVQIIALYHLLFDKRFTT